MLLSILQKWSVIGKLPYRVKTTLVGFWNGWLYFTSGQRDKGPDDPSPRKVIGEMWRTKLKLNSWLFQKYIFPTLMHYSFFVEYCFKLYSLYGLCWKKGSEKKRILVRFVHLASECLFIVVFSNNASDIHFEKDHCTPPLFWFTGIYPKETAMLI